MAQRPRSASFVNLLVERITNHVWYEKLEGLFAASKPVLIITLVVMVILQFQSSFHRFYRRLRLRLRHMSLKECLVDWFWMLVDYTRAGWHMGTDMLRSSWEGICNGALSTKVERPQRRLRSMRREGGLSAMPDLLREDASAEEAVKLTDARSKRNLEPAFMEEKRYPSGWLVFHSTLGVVAKGVADNFERASRPDFQLEVPEKPHPALSKETTKTLRGQRQDHNNAIQYANYGDGGVSKAEGLTNSQSNSSFGGMGATASNRFMVAVS